MNLSNYFFRKLKKMSVHVNPQNILEYFEIVVCYFHADNLHRHSITAALRYISSLYREHSQNYQCFCFEPQIFRLLSETLISRGYMNITYVLGNLELTMLL